MVFKFFKTLYNHYCSNNKPLMPAEKCKQRYTGSMYENKSREVQFSNQEWKKRNISNLTEKEYFAFKAKRTAELKEKAEIKESRLETYAGNLELQRARIESAKSPYDLVQERIRKENPEARARILRNFRSERDNYVDRLEGLLDAFFHNLTNIAFPEEKTPMVSRKIEEIDIFSKLDPKKA